MKRQSTTPRPKPTHNVPSGLGGSFAVHVVERDAQTALIEVHYRGGDFDGRRWRVPAVDLRPIAEIRRKKR